jgi:hypothetical protein
MWTWSTFAKGNIVMLRSEFQSLWRSSAPLAAVAILMVIGLAGAVAGLIFDTRVITGVPAWVKPAKFAASTALYSATVAWLFRYLTVWPRFVLWMGRLLALGLTVEVAIIFIQAARGTTSHFNVGTPLDSALFKVMGLFIMLLWLSSVGIMVALFRQTFSNRAWGWSLRLGMMITVLGAAAGGFMLRMAPEQAQAGIRQAPATPGAHTVGAPDGGPGLPVVGWSTEHGDLRISHFFGLHGVQAIPFFAWLISRRRWQQGRPSAAVFVLASSYVALIGILAWQALRGQSIVAPDLLTDRAFLIWMTGTAAALAAVLFRRAQIFETSVS